MTEIFIFIYLEKGSGERVTIPLSHGFNGEDMLGDPTPFDWGGNRGIGAAELAWSILQKRKPRASKELGLHTLEALTGIDEAADTGKVYEMTTSFERPRPLPQGYFAREMSGSIRADAEYALTL